MTRNQQQTLRILIPGTIIFIELLPLVLPPYIRLSLTYEGLGILASWGGIFLSLVVWPLLGILYWLTGIQNNMTRANMRVVNDNIRHRLLATATRFPDLSPYHGGLQRDPKLLEVFWRLVDQDPTLTNRSSELYFNGLVVTSLLDAKLLLLLGALVYWGAFLVTRSPTHLGPAVVLAALSVFCELLRPGRVKHHLDLSNNQLDHIDTYLLDELHTQLLLHTQGPGS